MTTDNTILVIDDEPSNIQIIFNFLQQADNKFKLLTSSNSKLGLDIAISAKPDVILTDWKMPGMSGIELISELKKNEITKDIPVIMITGIKLTSNDLKEALDCGAYDFIRKPIDEIELIARLNSALSFVKQFNSKVEFEKQIAQVNKEKADIEIQSQRREMLSLTTKLQRVAVLYEKFDEKLKSEECRTCSTCNFAQTHTNEMIKYTNQQIWNELDNHFKRINDDFFKRISKENLSLTPNERKLCA